MGSGAEMIGPVRLGGGGIDWCVRLLSCVCVGWGGGQIGYGCVRKVYPG